MRARKDNAMEIWLTGLPPKGVGWLTGGYVAHQRGLERFVEIVHSEAVDDWNTIDERRCFKIEGRVRTFEYQHLVKHPVEHWQHVPGYAKRIEDKSRDQVMFTWDVLMLDQDDLEWLFDLPEFEPADTGTPDLDDRQNRLERRVVDRMNDKIDAMLFGTITGGMTNTVSTGTALTAEQILADIKVAVARIRR